MHTLLKILAALGLVLLNGYFVAAEFAVVSARLSLLEALARRSFWSRLALLTKRKLDLYLSSCQLGVTLASLGLGAVIEPVVSEVLIPLLNYFRAPVSAIHGISFAVALGISSALHIVIGEQAPKNWAIRYADRVLPFLAPPLIAFTYIFFPAIWVLNWVTNAVLRLSGMKMDSTHGSLPHTEEELRSLLAQAVARGTIAKGHGRILKSALEFGDIKVRQIMTPRTEVDYLRLGQKMNEVLKTVKRAAYTRFPLVDGDLEHVVGLVHMKDLFAQLQLVTGRLRFTEERAPTGEIIAIADGLPGSEVHVIGSGDIDLTKIKRPVIFVPELTPLPKLLRQFQTTQMHMAIVVNEYGATLGIVTLEDVLEELVGEIDDEFDARTGGDIVIDGRNIRVSGKYALHALRDRIQLPEEDMGIAGVDTIGGLVTHKLGRWPRSGDTVEIGAYTARVLSTQQKRARQVLLSPAPKAAAQSGSAP